MHEVARTSTSSSVDPDLERAPPPQPTLVVFPSWHFDKPVPEAEFLKNLPQLDKIYGYVQKPTDVHRSHLACLNATIHEDVALEELLPHTQDGTSYLPPKTWTHMTLNAKNAKAARNSLDAFPQKYAILSNGTKAPDFETYNRFVLELHCETEDALRITGRRKPRPGIPPPPLGHFRRFWVHLETMSAFWDASCDHYYETTAKEPQTKHDAKTLRRFSVALGHKDPPTAPAGKRYRGRRISCGARMPEHFRIDVLRNFVEPIVVSFGCKMENPKRVPMLQLKHLQVPVTQTATVWRVPQDKAQSKRGILEGPIFGMQARGEHNFAREDYVSYLDGAREIAGLLLIAEERARESRENVVPGKGKWYTTKPRWGGGPGGEFGDAKGNEEIGAHGAQSKQRRLSLTGINYRPTEESIWRELKPGPSLWEPGHTYLAVGKDRAEQNDCVFMISSVLHHISILKLTVHPCYMDFLMDGKLPAHLTRPAASSTHLSPASATPGTQKPSSTSSSAPPPTWCQPRIYRSRWFNLFEPEDRTEAMRGIWGILAYAMRPGDNVGGSNSQDALGRNRSEDRHMSIFRRKSSVLPSPLEKIRSHSVAF